MPADEFFFELGKYSFEDMTYLHSDVPKSLINWFLVSAMTSIYSLIADSFLSIDFKTSDSAYS